MNDIKKVLITGASGFTGSAILKGLKNSEIHILKGRSIEKMTESQISDRLQGFDVVINLAGKSLFTLWTKGNRRKIYLSRINTTRKLAETINSMENPPSHYINASAIGIYRPETIVDESSKQFHKGFMYDVVRDWEREVLKINRKEVKVSILRLGLVFGRDGGAYRTLRILTRLNLGAYFNGGKQSISFIWIGDLVRAVNLIIERKIYGIINLTSPVTSDYRELLKLMKKELKAVILWPLPSFVARIMLGKVSQLVLEGHKVKPAVLLKNSFNFEVTDMKTCIKKLEHS